MKKILKNALAMLLSAAIFLGVSYLYLNYNFKKETAAADQKQDRVPYKQTPQNAEIVFDLPDKSKLYVLLDFQNMQINVSQSSSNISIVYTLELTMPLLEGLIDRVGGINLNTDGKILRYVGVQVCDLIENGYDSHLKNEIIMQIFKQISVNGFSKSDFIYLIENSKGDLKLVDCLDWICYIKEMSGKMQMSTDKS